jgi:hypothetical protein
MPFAGVSESTDAPVGLATTSQAPFIMSPGAWGERRLVLPGQIGGYADANTY